MRRGYTPPPPDEKDVTVYKHAEAVDQAAARTPIDRLLLVVHGIGQNLQGRCSTASVPWHLTFKGFSVVLRLCSAFLVRGTLSGCHASALRCNKFCIRVSGLPGAAQFQEPGSPSITANMKDWQCLAGEWCPGLWFSLYAPLNRVLCQSPSTALRSNIGDDAANVRAALAAAAVSDAGSGDNVTSRTEVLPVQWRKHLTLDVRRPTPVPAADQSATCLQSSVCAGN